MVVLTPTPDLPTLTGIEKMEINWTTVVSNAIGNSISGVIVATVLIMWNRSFNKFMKTMTGKLGTKEKDDGR